MDLEKIFVPKGPPPNRYMSQLVSKKLLDQEVVWGRELEDALNHMLSKLGYELRVNLRTSSDDQILAIVADYSEGPPD